MATLRKIYSDWSLRTSLTLREVTEPQPFLRAKLQGHFNLTSQLVELEVTKNDPTEEALRQAQREALQQQTSLGVQPPFGRSLGIWSHDRDFATPEVSSGFGSFERAFSLSVQSNTSSGRITSLQEAYERADARSVDVRGKISGTEVQVWARAFRPARRIELFLYFSNFPETALLALKAFCSPAYTDELERLQLDRHRVLFTSAEVTYRTGEQSFTLIPGIYFIADLALGPNLARRVEEDADLSLFGRMDDPSGVLLFASAPQVTLVLGSLRIEDAWAMVKRVRVRVVDDDGEQDSVIEARSWIGGTVSIGRSTWTLSGVLPRDHELLLLTLNVPQPLYSPLFRTLADLDPVMGGDDFWRASLPDPIRDSWGPFQIEEYAVHFALASGRLTSITCTLVPQGPTLSLGQVADLHLLGTRFRWTLGWPGDSEANVFIEGEGDLNIDLKTKNRLLTGFEATVTCTPRLEIHAVKEGSNEDEAALLAGALGLELKYDPIALAGQLDLFLTIVPGRLQVALEDAG